MATIKGTTKNGFAYELSEDVLDDWDLMVLLGKANENESAVAMDEAVTALLGEKQKKALKKHIKSIDGRVTVTGMSAALEDIFENEKLKNL